jgi:hypothetical protein
MALMADWNKDIFSGLTAGSHYSLSLFARTSYMISITSDNFDDTDDNKSFPT